MEGHGERASNHESSEMSLGYVQRFVHFVLGADCHKFLGIGPQCLLFFWRGRRTLFDEGVLHA